MADYAFNDSFYPVDSIPRQFAICRVCGCAVPIQPAALAVEEAEAAEEPPPDPCKLHAEFHGAAAPEPQKEKDEPEPEPDEPRRGPLGRKR